MTCKGCGAEIIWIKTPAGKNHPVDAEPKKMWFYEDHPVHYGWKLIDVHESHFSTCPNAAEFRNKRNEGKEVT